MSTFLGEGSSYLNAKKLTFLGEGSSYLNAKKLTFFGERSSYLNAKKLTFFGEGVELFHELRYNDKIGINSYFFANER